MNGNKNIVALKSVTDACQLCHAKALCLSAGLNAEDLTLFKNIVVHKKPMQRGERLFMAGEPINSIYVLHSGSVKSYLESADGDNQITAFYLPGDIVGIHGLENRQHSDTVEALETSSVCEIRFTDIDDMSKLFPALRKQLLRSIFRELSHDQEMMLVLGKLSANRRMAYFLLDIAKRFEEHGLSGRRLNLSMTRHDIANHLGLAVETVSRILTRLQKSGIIDVDRRSITIINRTLLEKIHNRSDGTGFKQLSG